MFQSLEVFQLASSMAAHAGRRQALIAQNVANSDTPGYVSRDMTSFADSVQNALVTQQKATRTRHLNGAPGAVGQGEVFSDKTLASPDGNTVSVEREMFKAVETRRQHERAIAIYKSGMDVLRMALSRQ